MFFHQAPPKPPPLPPHLSTTMHLPNNAKPSTTVLGKIQAAWHYICGLFHRKPPPSLPPPPPPPPPPPVTILGEVENYVYEMFHHTPPPPPPPPESKPMALIHAMEKYVSDGIHTMEHLILPDVLVNMYHNHPTTYHEIDAKVQAMSKTNILVHFPKLMYDIAVTLYNSSLNRGEDVITAIQAVMDVIIKDKVLGLSDIEAELVDMVVDACLELIKLDIKMNRAFHVLEGACCTF